MNIATYAVAVYEQYEQNIEVEIDETRETKWEASEALADTSAKMHGFLNGALSFLTWNNREWNTAKQEELDQIPGHPIDPTNQNGHDIYKVLELVIDITEAHTDDFVIKVATTYKNPYWNTRHFSTLMEKLDEYMENCMAYVMSEKIEQTSLEVAKTITSICTPT